MTLVEKMARAIDLQKPLRTSTKEQARAALQVVLNALREPSEELIDLSCETYSDAFVAAARENRERHEELRKKYPEVPPREKHGAAGVQTWPPVLRAIADHLAKE